MTFAYVDFKLNFGLLWVAIIKTGVTSTCQLGGIRSSRVPKARFGVTERHLYTYSGYIDGGRRGATWRHVVMSIVVPLVVAAVRLMLLLLLLLLRFAVVQPWLSHLSSQACAQTAFYEISPFNCHSQNKNEKQRSTKKKKKIEGKVDRTKDKGCRGKQAKN